MRPIILAVALAFALSAPAAADAAAPQRVQQVFEEFVSPSASSVEKSRQLDLVGTIMDLVTARYAVEVDLGRLTEAAVKGIEEADLPRGAADSEKVAAAAITGMLTSLDPHTSYLDTKTFEEMRIQTRGEFAGLGIQVTMEGGLVKVVTPIDGTPAFHAGLKAGDVITHLDGQSIRGLTLGQAVVRMRGRVGTRIRLTVRRPGREPFDVAITRATIIVRPVSWRLEGDVGYLRITDFSEQTGKALTAALSELRSQGGGLLKGIVLDLRNNPGGLLDQSVAVSDAFLERGTIVSIRGRDAESNAQFPARPGDLAQGVPLVVLVNGGTATGAEIVASALQDHRRATVMGTRSFGKGTVQTIIPIADHGALRLTTALYYSPLGRSIQRHGVVPDILVAGKNGADRRREGDLPGALEAVDDTAPEPEIEISEDDCPGAGEMGDRNLGCALVFLRAGTTDAFLAAIRTRTVPARLPSVATREAFPRISLAVSFRKAAQQPDDIAVIIGNANYGKLGKDIPDVVPAYADAEGFKRYVTQALGVREGNIIELRDATGSQIVRVFGSKEDHRGQLYDWVRPGRSRVYVYYAGHGAPAGKDGSAYLVPSDADAARIHLNGYPLATLYKNLGKLPAQSVTVVLEACFSGASQKGTVVPKASPIYLRPKVPPIPPNLTVIAAGAANQIASWEEDSSHSLFSKYFLKGMSGEADKRPYGDGDGKVGWKELDAYLNDTLTYYARRYYGRDQNAQIMIGGAG